MNLKYRTLDHWRGVAALWVVLFHGFGTTYEVRTHPITEMAKIVAAPGWLGVHLFFVISGYCIAAAALQLEARQGTPAQFAMSRFLRIMPTYWAAFAAALAIGLIALPFNHATLAGELPSGWSGWLGNLFLIQPYLGARYYVIVYWSLVVEVGFYAIVVILLILRRSSPTLAWGLGATLTAICAAAPPSNPYLIVFRFWPEFVCGSLVLFALQARLQRSPYAFAGTASILGLGVGGAALALTGRDNQLWFSAAFALSLLALYPLDGRLMRVRALNWLATVGAFSYCLYLIHLPFGGRVIGLGRRVVADTSLAFVALQVTYIGVSIASAYALHRLAERRFEMRRHAFHATQASPSRQSSPLHENPSFG